MADFFSYGKPGFIALVALIEIVFFMLVLGPGIASILTWLERRQSAMMQDRVGPNRAYLLPPRKGETRGRWRMWGITHFMADALKFLFKEDFVPPKAHKLLFALGPILALAPALIVSAIIPFGPDICWGHITEVVPAGTCATPVHLQAARLDVGILFYFAISSLSVYGATLAGWASYNKWSLMGGVRASSQMMSYEVTMGMAVLVMFLVYGTLEPGAMVDQQGGWIWQWGIVGGAKSLAILPCIVSFILFLTAAIAETKRTPFDIPEGEPEIIGYFVEYSGMRFGLFFLGEFIEIVFSSALLVTIFFGGWHSGVGVLDQWIVNNAPNGLVVLYGMGVFLGKTFTFCSFQLLIRWSLPRFRSDQLMQLGWQRLLPVSIANVLIAAGWMLFAN
ncbi:MAG TPA: complex I subunit 1 family protein [Polyangia bacterium]|nr:complex I subunit 1 family protein [Polyangia bacterium]